MPTTVTFPGYENQLRTRTYDAVLTYPYRDRGPHVRINRVGYGAILNIAIEEANAIFQELGKVLHQHASAD